MMRREAKRKMKRNRGKIKAMRKEEKIKRGRELRDNGGNCQRNHQR